MESSLLSKPFLGTSSKEGLSGFGWASLSSDLRTLSYSFLHFSTSSSTHKKLQVQAAGSTFGTHFRVTTFGESYGGGVGCVIDGVPPRLPISEADLQVDLDRRH